MLKYRKNLVSLCINTFTKSINGIDISSYRYLLHTTLQLIQEILDKLQRNVRNVLETPTANFWNILIMISWNLQENLGATSEIGQEKIRIDFNGKFRKTWKMRNNSFTDHKIFNLRNIRTEVAILIGPSG